MKILNLQAENIKRLIAVDITPDSNVVQITGKNGQGKTSVLDAIWWCLGGAFNIQAKPIHTGANDGYVQCDLGDIVVTRKFKFDKHDETTSSIKVESKDGGKLSSPQSVIDELLGNLTFDPLLFARMDPKKQFETLRQFVPDVDFEEIDDANKADYGERTQVNRQYNEKRSVSLRAHPKTAEQERIDTDDLMKQIEAGADKNADIVKRQANRDNMKRNADEKQAQSNKLLIEADEILKKLRDAGKLPEPTDISELRADYSAAESINKAIDEYQETLKFEDEAKKFKAESERLTKQIEDRNAKKQDAIANADLPVDGITFGDGEVILNGQPFEQASDAEQLRASLSIAMALNPKLRVIRVRDGSLLDDDSMKIVEKMAQDNDFQIWIERVDGSGKVGFVMEEGMVKGSQDCECEI